MHLDKLVFILKILIVNSFLVVESFKYLFIFPSSVRSPFIFGSPLAKALAKKGHEVYVISAFPEEQPIKNYYDITLDLREKGILNFNHYANELDNSEGVLQDPNVQQLIYSNHTFDAVICEASFSDALFGFSEHFKAPLVVLASIAALPLNTHALGSPSPPSYVPFPLSTYTDHMTFSERLANLFYITRENNVFHSQVLPKQVALYNKYFPHLQKDLHTVRKNAAAILLNTHVSLSYPRPYMPNQIEVAGMHINHQPQPLPEDIQQFIQEAEHGVVYCSMGSFLKGTDLPHAALYEFVRAFSAMKQRVLWKFEKPNFLGRHKNIYLWDWFPQDDILHHENVKALITTGGMSSISEGIYHAKPIIGIPIFLDQFSNMAKVENQGIGIKLDFQTITAAQLVETVKRITTDRRYTERVKAASARYRSQPISPLDLAVYWVEHVARHKGAKYMRCAGLDLSFIEYHNIDAILILYGGTLSLLSVFVYSIIVLAKAGLKKMLSHRARRRLRRSRRQSLWWELLRIVLWYIKCACMWVLKEILPRCIYNPLERIVNSWFESKEPRRLPNFFKLRQCK